MRKERVLSKLKSAETNMTSMIDVVFLLISFFTLVMNFSQAEQHEEIALPNSELAQPPESAPPEMITIQILADHTIYIGSVKCAIENDAFETTSFGLTLAEELRLMNLVRKVQPQDVTMILRGDGDVDVDYVQKVILACQSLGADSFVLRARQARGD